LWVRELSQSCPKGVWAGTLSPGGKGGMGWEGLPAGLRGVGWEGLPAGWLRPSSLLCMSGSLPISDASYGLGQNAAVSEYQ
jgi:hypothetical protein